MGSVYRARDLHFPSVVKLVAIKEMINRAPDPLVRKTVVQNFEREANILATLNHPSIPPIYDYFSGDNRSYLVLEFVHGHDLEAIINETGGFLTEERVLGWAIELCDVLSFLHSHKPDPIIFRDMKPSNVMVNPTDHIILVDFGIAKPFQVGQKGTMIGTEGYSPPEQYRGEAGPLADVYALGATIHHALSRRDPRLEPPFSIAPGDQEARRAPADKGEYDDKGNCGAHNHASFMRSVPATGRVVLIMERVIPFYRTQAGGGRMEGFVYGRRFGQGGLAGGSPGPCQRGIAALFRIMRRPAGAVFLCLTTAASSRRIN